MDASTVRYAAAIGSSRRVEIAVHVEAARGGAGQDRAVCHPFATHLVVIVADGAGGTGGGAEAAEYVVRRGLEQIAVERSAASLCAILEAIDRELAADRTAGETTAVVLCVTGRQIAGASVGDSQAELVHRDGSSDTLTHQQQRKPLLGSGEAVIVGFEAELGSDTLVVGSDGLFAYVDARARAKAIAHNLDARALAELARLPSGKLPDDVAVVLVRAASRRILLVENDSVFARVVTEAFLSAHDVTCVGSVAAARDALDRGAYDVLLCDYDLDDGKGDELVRDARRRGFAGPIVAISSHDAGNAALMQAGCTSACPKLQFDRIARYL